MLGVTRGAPADDAAVGSWALAFGANMWRLALAPVRDPRWWLAQHMNGAMLNFIATHDSFLALGVGSVVPELRQPVPRMLVAAVVIATGLTLRMTAHRWAAPTSGAGPARDHATGGSAPIANPAARSGSHGAAV